MGYAQIEVEPLTRHVGAEVRGVDLRQPLSDALLGELRSALLEYGVIFFRDQELTHDRHKAFARRFGSLHIHPSAPGPEGHPEILVIHADENSRAVAGGAWHSDVSADPEPPMGSVLYMERVPEAGGDTLFASATAAYEALSEPIRQLLLPLVAVHRSDHVYVGARPARQGEAEFPSAEHPVIRTHPETGRRAIFVNRGFTTRIRGLRRPESEALLRFLFEHCASAEFQCRFRWRPGSVAFWDNRAVQHYAVWDYFPAIRHGYRVTIQGDRPYLDREVPAAPGGAA